MSDIVGFPELLTRNPKTSDYFAPREPRFGARRAASNSPRYELPHKRYFQGKPVGVEDELFSDIYHIFGRNRVLIERVFQSSLSKMRIDRMASEYALLLEEALLPDNWDGENAIAVTGGAATVAGTVLFRISRMEGWSSYAVPDNLTATGDGGLFMDWDLEHERLELFVGDQATLTLVVVSKKSGRDHSWSSYKNILLEEFLQHLHGSCNQAVEEANG